jgi:hypothetical protein
VPLPVAPTSKTVPFLRVSIPRDDRRVSRPDENPSGDDRCDSREQKNRSRAGWDVAREPKNPSVDPGHDARKQKTPP